MKQLRSRGKEDSNILPGGLEYGLLSTMIFMVASLMSLDVKGSDTLPSDPALCRGQLENGFTYYLRDTEHANTPLEIHLVVKAGYFHEDKKQLHVAHVLEHAAFASTTNYDDVWGLLAGKGLELGRDFGASTGYSNTNYWFRLPTADTVLLLECLGIIRDWCQGINTSASVIDIERKTVLNELGKTRSSCSDIGAAVIGNPVFNLDNEAVIESVKTFERRELVRFYRKWYTPGNQALIVCGPVNVAWMESKIRDVFGSLKSRRPRKHIHDWSPGADPSPLWLVDSCSQQTTTNLFDLIYKVPDRPLITAADLNQHVITLLFNKMAADRALAVNKNDKACHANMAVRYVENYLFPDANIDILNIQIAINRGTQPGIVLKNIVDILGSMEAIVKYGFSEREFQAAKRIVYGEISGPAGISSADVCRIYADNFIDNSVAMDSQHLKSETIKMMQRITLNDINKNLRQWYVGRTPDVVVHAVQGDQKLLPTQAVFNKSLIYSKQAVAKPDSVANELHFTESDLLADSLKRFKPGLSIELVSKELDKCAGATTLVLKNGIKVILKPFKPTGVHSDKIMIKGLKLGGAHLFSGNDYSTSLHSAGVVFSSGVFGIDRNALNRYLNDNGVEIFPVVEDDFVGFEGEVRIDGMPLALELVYKYINDPPVTLNGYNSFLNANKTQSSFSRSLIDSIRSKHTVSEAEPVSPVIDQIDINHIRKVFYDLFANANGFTFIFTGEFDPLAIEALIIHHLGGLPGNKQLPRDFHTENGVKKSSSNKIPTRAFQLTQKRKDRESIVNILFIGQEDVGNSHNLPRAAVRTLLEDRLLTRLRREIGGVYSVSVYDSDVGEGKFQFGISFTTSFGDIELLVDALWDEIGKLKASPITNETMNWVVRQETNRLNRTSGSHYFWLKGFENDVLRGATRYDGFCKVRDAISDLSTTEIAAALQKYLDYENLELIYRND